MHAISYVTSGTFGSAAHLDVAQKVISTSEMPQGRAFKEHCNIGVASCHVLIEDNYFAYVRQTIFASDSFLLFR